MPQLHDPRVQTDERFQKTLPVPGLHQSRDDEPSVDQLLFNRAGQEADRRPIMASPDARFADLDAMGIDKQLISPAPPQCYYAVPAEVGAKAARLVNDGIAAVVAKHPDRFTALGSVPTTGPSC